jgi:hypothetical protein
MGLGEGSAKSVLRTWMSNNVLVVADYHNPVRRRSDKGLFVNYDKLPGENDA